MRVAFFHDAPLVRTSNGEIYSNGFGYDLWTRYLAVFDIVSVSTRMVDGAGDGLVRSSGRDVVFQPISSFSRASDALLAWRAIWREVRLVAAGADCVIVRLPSILGWYAYVAARWLRKPVLVEMVGCPWDAYWNHGILGKVAAPFAFFVTRMCVNHAKFVLYVTEEFLQRRYPTHGSALACSDVVLSERDAAALDSRMRRIGARAKCASLVLCTVGAIDVPYKGHEYVLRAMCILKGWGIRSTYWVIGGGDSARLERLVLDLGLVDDVKFFGNMPHIDVLSQLKRADVYIQPSRVDALPRALLEAMSVGLPAIGSKVGGIPELLDDGCLFKAGDVASLARHLAHLDATRLEQMALENIRRIDRDYHPRLLTERREAFFVQFRHCATRKPVEAE